NENEVCIGWKSLYLRVELFQISRKNVSGFYIVRVTLPANRVGMEDERGRDTGIHEHSPSKNSCIMRTISSRSGSHKLRNILNPGLRPQFVGILIKEWLFILVGSDFWPTLYYELILSESWVELNPVPDRITPLPFSSGGEEYLRLLREAQRDSLPSSARHSLASSRRGTPRDSCKTRCDLKKAEAEVKISITIYRETLEGNFRNPKSPPNSPNTELSTEDELKGVYINYCCNKVSSIIDF
ncbi:hypothetical protein E2986_12056, partial [Frieseomelitta varia]